MTDPLDDEKVKIKKRKAMVSTVEQSLARRHRAETRFKAYGLCAIMASFFFLMILFGSIVSKGYSAFYHSEIQLSLTFDAKSVERDNTRKIIHNALKKKFPDVTDRNARRDLYQLVSKSNIYKLKDMLTENADLKGQTADMWLTTSSDIDMYLKGNILEDIASDLRKVSDQQIAWIQSLDSEGKLRNVFNTTFFTAGDSREPEMAGFAGSMIGSFLIVIVCLLLAFPVGVCAALYLEEFAPKNRITDIVEVNINNLAAIPSIVFGLLGLSVYIQVMGVPRSSALVGGLTLALMALPMIVITTRSAIKAIPQSIRDGAIALGATKMQTTFHHVLPLAIPGIMTGTILSIARVLGETAPLIMIGLTAFVVDIPKTFTSATTAMPVQIYLWADSPEIGFIEKTSAGILILIAFLIAFNALAVYIRKRFETRW